MKPEMSVKERWLACLGMGPVDRMPFWPKIGGTYARRQPEPFRDMGAAELHAHIGSDTHSWVGSCLAEARRGQTGLSPSMEGNLEVTQYVTPYGSLRQTAAYDPGTGSSHPVEYPVKRAEDLKVMAAWYEGQDWAISPEGQRIAERVVERAGGDAVFAVDAGTTPIMWFMQNLAGIEVGHYLLADRPDLVEELLTAMMRPLLRRCALIAEYCPADVIYLIQNTTTNILSPDQYRRYEKREAQAALRVLKASGKPVVLHMCGHLRAILPDLAELGADAFEAFTPPTVGDATLAQGRAACPDTCLIGGTNASWWTTEADSLIGNLGESLDSLPHHRGIAVTSAGMMPQSAPVGLIKEVCEWVRAYPARM